LHCIVLYFIALYCIVLLMHHVCAIGVCVCTYHTLCVCIQWWYSVVVHSSGTQQWHNMVVQCGGTIWWFSVVVQCGGTIWWYNMVVQYGSHSIHYCLNHSLFREMGLEIVS
jgi:hypothetical protein